MKNQNEALELVRRVLDDEATEEEFAKLEDLLRTDSEFRKEYLRYLHVDSALASRANVPKSTEPRIHKPAVSVPFLKWSRLATAAAAGLVLGLFCASVAWAIMVPRKPLDRIEIPVLSESFENAATTIAEGFPTQTGVWGGDIAKIVVADSAHQPAHGKSMLSLDTGPNSNLGFIQQIFEVSSLPHAEEGEMRTLEAIASFLADQPGENERYTLRIATFKESPQEIRALWEGVPWREMDASTLTMAKSGLFAPSDADGWQTLSTVVEVPKEARCLVISLAAGRQDKTAPKTPHYLDDIRANLVISPFKKLKRRVTNR